MGILRLALIKQLFDFQKFDFGKTKVLAWVGERELPKPESSLLLNITCVSLSYYSPHRLTTS